MQNVPCKDLVAQAAEQVKTILQQALVRAQQEGSLPDVPLPPIGVEIPADISHGDFSSNIAMVSAKLFRLPPRKIADLLLQQICFDHTWFMRAEVAGPGFLNLFLNPSWFVQALMLVDRLGENYGRTDYGAGKKYMVEFVSANPTGPMHMGNARGGAIGDCLAAALDAAGYQVTREFYINDAGNQIEKFALSLEARYLQIYQGEENIPFPEDGYHGEDILDRAKEFAQMHGNQFVDADSAARKQALVDYALPHNIEKLRSDLATYRIAYDVWFPESQLYDTGAVTAVVDKLRERGLAYEKDGAIWYQATAFGAEKDEVLIRQNGNATYFAADIAYHYNKFSTRGYDTVINVWGADHHGHVARLKGAMDAVGLSGDRLHIVLMQLVRLMKDGEPYRMSKRTGRSVTLSDLIDMVPIDAARFFFNMREPNSTMDFDLNLAVQQNADNPVYYVQYAHARICSILKKLHEEGTAVRAATEEDLAQLTAEEEIALIRRIAEYPSEIVRAATSYDPARLTHYVIDLATLFHKFYAACRVRVEDESRRQARICLCLATRTTLANALALLKIDAPTSM